MLIDGSVELLSCYAILVAFPTVLPSSSGPVKTRDARLWAKPHS